MPPEYVSHLEFFLSTFVSVSGLQRIWKQTFASLIEELNFLEQNGITINVNGNIYKIYFVLSLLFSDNLGIHAMCGFIQNFRANIRAIHVDFVNYIVLLIKLSTLKMNLF